MKTWFRHAVSALLAVWALCGCDIPSSESFSPVASVVGLNPETGTVLETSAPRLSWEPIPEASIYQVQLTDTLEDLESTPMMEVPDASIIPSDSLNSMTTYYWRVRALNTDRRAGPWSEVHSFVLRYYITGEANAEIWNTGDGYSRYQAQIDSALDRLDGATLEESAPDPDMTRYYFSYQQIDEDGENSSWSAVFSTEIGWSEQIAGLGIEKDGMSVIGLLGKGILDGMEFRIAIAEDRAELDAFAARRVSWIELFLLARMEGQIFHWQVRPQNETGDAIGTWRNASTLLLKHAWNGEIFNPVPANGHSTTDTTPELSWDAVIGADKYQIQIADAEEAISTAAISEAPSASHTPQLPLTNLQDHYWRVRAVNADGQFGPYSEIQTIRVNWGDITGISPADGHSTTDTTPALSWDTVEGAVRYQIQIANTKEAVSTTAKDETASASHTPNLPLANLQAHYWRVRAVDTDGQFGLWSDIQAIHVNWGGITNPSPADGHSTTDTTPELSWEAVDGAGRYQMQIADTEEAISTAAITEAASVPHTPNPPLTNLQAHYWRVRAVDTDGQFGLWSDIQAIHVNWGGITNPSPADGHSTTDTTPELSWEAVDGAGRYQMQIADTEEAISTAAITEAASVPHTPNPPLANLQTHYWRTRAVDADGQFGLWSDIQAIHVNWGSITNPSPADGQSTTDTTPELSWEAVDGAGRYQIQIADTEEAISTAAITEAGSVPHTPNPPLTNLQAHYWRVRAVDTDGQFGLWSDIQAIHVNWGGITNPSPADGHSTTDTTPELNWDAVDGVLKYQMQFADTKEAVSTAAITEAASVPHTPNPPLTNLQAHYWRTRAVDADGQFGPWSEIQAIHVNWGGITNPIPADGHSTTDTTPELNWDTVDGADRYQIQIADTEEAVSTATITEVASVPHTPNPPLTNLQTHYWRTRAVDADGQFGLWSEIQAIHVNWGGITNPIPADGHSTTDTTPEFQWDAVDGALKYQMQVAPISNDLDRAPLTDTTGPSHTPSQSLTNLQTYRWRVRAVDLDDQFGPWSGAKTVKIEWGTLENPVPSDGQSTADTTPEFKWDTVDGALKYQMQVANTKEAISTAVIIETVSPSHTPQLPLTNLQTHYWRAQAVDAAGHFGPWSESRAIHVNWGSIANPDPADGQSVATTTPQFKWDAVDGALKYQMQAAPISDDLDRASITDTTGPSHTPSQSLTNLQTYRWRARAVDADGQHGQWTAPQSVFVDWGKITGITPPSGAGTANPSPSLSWDSLSNTAGYEVRFSSSDNLESAATQSVTESEYTPTISLEKNRLYYWQVRALHDDGFWGPWSDDFILAVIPYLVYVEGGTFTMGSPESESYRDEDETQHEVSVSSFYIGKYEVTAREYYDVMGDRAGVYYSQRNGGPSSRFMGDDDDYSGNGNFPAFAGWYDAVEFCNALSRRDGLEPVYTITYSDDGTSVESVEADWTAIGYRLPTEAEWEYAARGGRNSNGYLYAGSDDPVDVAWFRQSSIILTGHGDLYFELYKGGFGVSAFYPYPHDVGYLQANELGLHDMSGNAAEWCWDWYAADYYEAGSTINPRGPATGTAKVARGGHCYSPGGAVEKEQTYAYKYQGRRVYDYHAWHEDRYADPDNNGTLRVASRYAHYELGQLLPDIFGEDDGYLTTVGFRIVLPLSADEGGP